MKKLMALLLASCLLLAGCGDKQQTKGEGEDTPAPQVNTQTEPETIAPDQLSGTFLGSWVDQYTGDKYTFCGDNTLSYAPSNSNTIYAGSYTLQQQGDSVQITLGVYVSGTRRDNSYTLSLNGDGMDFLDQSGNGVASLIAAESPNEGVLQQGVDTTGFYNTPQQAEQLLIESYGDTGEGGIRYQYTLLGVTVLNGASWYVFDWSAYIGSEPTFVSLVLAGCNKDQVCMAGYSGEYIVAE